MSLIASQLIAAPVPLRSGPSASLSVKERFVGTWKLVSWKIKDANGELGFRLIKSTIQEQRRGRQRPDNFVPTCRSGSRYA
jgi:hypothetical protein